LQGHHAAIRGAPQGYCYTRANFGHAIRLLIEQLGRIRAWICTGHSLTRGRKRQRNQ